MFKTGSFAIRFIGVLLLLGLMIGGGAMAYRAGVAQGIAQAPAMAEALSNAAESGQFAPMPAYGYHSFGMRPHFGFFPFGRIFGFFLFIFLFFGLMRMIFFRRWAWHHYGHHGHGPWKERGPWGAPHWPYGEKEGQEESDSEKKEEK